VITLRTPQLAFVPARVPTGYHYRKWRFAKDSSTLRIWFRNKAGKDIVFSSTWQYESCAAGKQKTFQLAGVKVYWGQGVNDQEAWRCVAAPGTGGVLVELAATTTQPPTTFADVGLGRVVASAHKIR
jgi:hypothetical protein